MIYSMKDGNGRDKSWNLEYTYVQIYLCFYILCICFSCSHARKLKAITHYIREDIWVRRVVLVLVCLGSTRRLDVQSNAELGRSSKDKTHQLHFKKQLTGHENKLPKLDFRFFLPPINHTKGINMKGVLCT